LRYGLRVARAGARIRGKGGKGKGGFGHRLPLFLPHIPVRVKPFGRIPDKKTRRV
jgi:hypothetical protein